jgi:pilus assembly protein CpaF
MTGTLPRPLLERVIDQLVRDGTQVSVEGVAAAIRTQGVVVDEPTVAAVTAAARSELRGAGPLDVLLADADVTDVLVNGPDDVWVDRGNGLVRAAVRFPDEAAVRRLAQRLAATAGRRLDAACPMVDARLADGTRLHAVLPPLSPAGTLLSLRVLRRRAFSLDQLISMGSVSVDMAAVLRSLVLARVSFLVTGGTGTGKTTLLSTLLSVVDPGERVVLVEDSGELTPDHPHVVRLEARSANAEGRGQVDLRMLVRQALRMRPDRLVVGEVRGAEVVDLLAALNTGHDGGCGTLHAGSCGAVPARVEALALAAGLDRAAAHAQLAAGVGAVVHLARRPDGRRIVAQVGVTMRRDDGLVSVDVAHDLAEGRLRPGPAARRLQELLEPSPADDRVEASLPAGTGLPGPAP